MKALGAYSFLPWLRQGLGNQITAADFDLNVKLRASARVQLEFGGEAIAGGTLTEAVSRDVALYGPGDIVGIEPRAIVRTEPRHYITDFEPNYLPHVEFYDEDLPWRYTPAIADVPRHRLRPWITLLVLEEDEFRDAAGARNRPLPSITIPDRAVFPPPDQLWAHAHVHVNASLSDTEFLSTDMNAVLPRLNSTLAANSDEAYSRLLSFRRLKPNKGYHAFVIPTFESGRLAGLGLDPAASPSATFSAWEDYPPGAGARADGQSYPYYFRWYFHTGATGDFEYLVRLLKPKPVDKRVGTRDMDVLDPGSNVPGIEDPGLRGILKLGGALRVPRDSYTPEELLEVLRYENWATPYPHIFQQKLAALINLSDTYQANSVADAHADDADLAGDPDPLITPPLYGRWHALTQRLLIDRNGNPVPHDKNWVHEVNLDPVYRVPAGFGTRVIQNQQETYMNAAWEQVGQVLEANRKVRLGQVAREVSLVWFYRHLLPIYEVSPERALVMTAPVQSRVMSGEVTVVHQFRQSRVQPPINSVVMRRALRPGGRLIRNSSFQGNVQRGNLLARVNRGEVSPAPPRARPPAIPTINDVVTAAEPSSTPIPVRDFFRRYPWLRYVLLALGTIFLVFAWRQTRRGQSPLLAFSVATLFFELYRRLLRDEARYRQFTIVREENRRPESVSEMPSSPDFRITIPDERFMPTIGETDSAEATRFKTAIRDSYTLVGAAGAASVPLRRDMLTLNALATTTLNQLFPAVTVPRRVLKSIDVPARIKDQIGETFDEVMAYPEIDVPMYKPLTEASSELFLPNINLIEVNSITLLETNQKFIEAYMVGVNHEFSRELLWREYPTDMRGSYFRQFWDVSSFLPPAGAVPSVLREKLRDIPPLDRWPKASKLGEHDARERPGDSEEEIVVVIRGELLKRYPTAVIYAQHARWPLKSDGSIDRTVPREFDEPSTPEEEASPPRSKVRTPLYEAKVDPDIYFFGFDLTIPTARGGTGENPNDDPGWFIVIKERPGEPRFGLDIDRQTQRQTWNDMSWADVTPPAPEGSFLQISNATAAVELNSTPPASETEKRAQHDADANFIWNRTMSSAELAYILFQVPVLVGVHASEMLPRR